MSPVYINGVEQVVAHASKHQDTGTDEISVAALSGELADRQKSKAGTSVLGWTDEKLLKGAGAGVAPDEIDVPTGTLMASGTYTGNSTVNRAIPHGLGSTPKMVLIIDWSTATYWFRIISLTAYIFFVALAGFSSIAVTAPDGTNFYVGNAGNYSGSANLLNNVYYWVAIG